MGCHMYPLLNQSYFHNLSLHSSYKIHQPFTDYFLRLPYSELLEKRVFRSRANRRLVLILHLYNELAHVVSPHALVYRLKSRSNCSKEVTKWDQWDERGCTWSDAKTVDDPKNRSSKSIFSKHRRSIFWIWSGLGECAPHRPQQTRQSRPSGCQEHVPLSYPT